MAKTVTKPPVVTVNSITVPKSTYERTSVQIIQSPPKPPTLKK